MHYRLCEDLDGTQTLASFQWPGLSVYLGAVTGMATRLRFPANSAVVLAAGGQSLLLQCLYGACSAGAEAFLADVCEENATERSEAASFQATGASEWPWEPPGRGEQLCGAHRGCKAGTLAT